MCVNKSRVKIINIKIEPQDDKSFEEKESLTYIIIPW